MCPGREFAQAGLAELLEVKMLSQAAPQVFGSSVDDTT